MRGRYTARPAKIFFFSPIGPVLLIIGVFTTQMVIGIYLIQLSAALMVLEIVAKLFKMPLPMLWRKFIRALYSMIFSRNLKANPSEWSRKHWPVVIVGAVLSIGSLTNPEEVQAELAITDSMSWDRQWRAGAVGMRQEDILEAICNECPLDIAMQMVLPDDFQHYISQTVNESIRVSFVPGKPWGQILEGIASTHDLDIEVMRDGNRVVIDPAPSNRGSVRIASNEPVYVAARENKFWELIPGDTLKGSLERWATVENWHIVFNLKADVAIDVYARFEGTLLESIENVLAAYKANGTLSRVEMVYSHANRVVSIGLIEGDRTL